MRPPTFTNVLLDHHIYSIFNDNIYLSHKDRLQYYCNQRSDISSANQYHYLVTGEWTTTPTDCAKYVNGRGIGARYDGSYPGFKSQGSCSSKTGSGANFSSTFKSQLKDLFDTQRNVYEKSGSGVSARIERDDSWPCADLFTPLPRSGSGSSGLGRRRAPTSGRTLPASSTVGSPTTSTRLATSSAKP